MTLTTSLDRLESTQLIRHLIEDEPAYVFKHALVQDTAYESLLKQARREIHLQVAKTIEQLYADRLDEFAALLAQHYMEAGDEAKTVEYALRAGDVAAKIFAYPEARVHYALALDALARLPDDDENRQRRVDAIVKQVSVSLRAEGPSETLKRLEQAEAIARPFAERNDATREDRLRLARVEFWQGHALLHNNNSRASLQKMQQVLTVAQGEHDPMLLAVSGSVVGRSLIVQGQFARAIPILTDAITALEETHDEHEWIFSVGMRGFAIAMRGDVTRGVAEAERALARANQTASLTGISIAHMILSLTYLFGDSIPLAIEHAHAIIAAAAQSGDRLHAYIGHSYLAWAQTRANQFAEAEQNFARAKNIAQAIGGRLAFSDWFLVASAELAFRETKFAQAIAKAQEAIASIQDGTGTFHGGLARRFWGQSLARQNPPDWAQAQTHFATALELFTACEASLEAARTHVVWGKILRERGEVNSSQEHFEKALAQFEGSGLTRELEETRALLSTTSRS